jgi:hypothetical protein
MPTALERLPQLAQREVQFSAAVQELQFRLARVEGEEAEGGAEEAGARVDDAEVQGDGLNDATISRFVWRQCAVVPAMIAWLIRRPTDVLSGSLLSYQRDLDQPLMRVGDLPGSGCAT